MMTKTGTMTMVPRAWWRITNNIIKSQEVVSVMKQVDRGNNPYMESPQYIGYINISAPHIHAHALELLRGHLKPGMQQPQQQLQPLQQRQQHQQHCHRRETLPSQLCQSVIVISAAVTSQTLSSPSSVIVPWPASLSSIS